MTSVSEPVPQPAGSQAGFRLLFETNVTPVAILDERRRLLDMNPAGLRLLCQSSAPLAGEPAEEAVVASERARSESDWRQLLREGRLHGRRTLIRADGSEVEVVFAAVVESVAGARRAVYTLTPTLAANGAAQAVDGELEIAPASLTVREVQVVRLIAGGMDTSEIAATLNVSPNTVRSHVRNAMSKFSARTRAQLVAHVLGADGAGG